VVNQQHVLMELRRHTRRLIMKLTLDEQQRALLNWFLSPLPTYAHKGPQQVKTLRSSASAEGTHTAPTFAFLSGHERSAQTELIHY
jgi:hypothetical protein